MRLAGRRRDIGSGSGNAIGTGHVVWMSHDEGELAITNPGGVVSPLGAEIAVRLKIVLDLHFHPTIGSMPFSKFGEGAQELILTRRGQTGVGLTRKEVDE